MKRLTPEELRELRKEERVLIDDKMQELAGDDVVNCLTGKSNAESSKVEKVDIKNLARIAAELHNDVASRFKGVPVIMDDKLIGHNYYIAVSPDLYEQIMVKKDE